MTNEEMLWNEEHQMDEVSLCAFEALVDKIFDEDITIKAREMEIKAQKDDLSKLKERAISIMEKYGKVKHAGRFGTLSLKLESYPSVPSNPEDRARFFGHLKDRGIFESMVTVNPQTLKSYFKAEREAAADPVTFSIPGLTPFEKKSLSVRRTK